MEGRLAGIRMNKNFLSFFIVFLSTIVNAGGQFFLKHRPASSFTQYLLTLISKRYFDEEITLIKKFGISLIIIGTFLVV